MYYHSGLSKQPFQFAVHSGCEGNKRADWVFSAVKLEEMEDWMTAFRVSVVLITFVYVEVGTGQYTSYVYTVHYIV